MRLVHLTVLALGLASALALTSPARAQAPVTPAADHEVWLASPDARLAANKRLVYDFCREVLEAGHVELAGKYLTESYIQHNPQIPSGRAALVAAFSQQGGPRPIKQRMQAPLVAIVAEGNLVVMSFVRQEAEPGDKSKRYTTTWFDMFRIEGDQIAEHWDGAVKP